MSKYQIEADYELDKGCRCLSCWSPTGKWVVTHDIDIEFEMLFDTEEAAKEWVEKMERCPECSIGILQETAFEEEGKTVKVIGCNRCRYNVVEREK